MIEEHEVWILLKLEDIGAYGLNFTQKEDGEALRFYVTKIRR